MTVALNIMASLSYHVATLLNNLILSKNTQRGGTLCTREYHTLVEPAWPAPAESPPRGFDVLPMRAVCWHHKLCQREAYLPVIL